MAAGSEGSMKLHLVHGAKNHFITVAPSEEDENNVLAVRHLTATAQELTGIPPERQKLIFKGKSLTQNGDPNQSLSSFGLRHGSKIMVLGTKGPVDNFNASDAQDRTPLPSQPLPQANDPYQVDLRKLDGIEQRLNAEETTLSALLQQSQQLYDKGNADSGQLEQARKGLLSTEEGLMRHLESLDTLRFDPSDMDARTKRKALVNRIQKHMDQCEEMMKHLKQTLASRK